MNPQVNPLTMPPAVEAFVAATNAHDGEALLAAFAPGAAVVDDGTTYTTEARIREWIRVHQVEPRIVITPGSYETGRLVASVDGDFPGGPLAFEFAFTTEHDLITHLSIAAA